MSKMTIFRHSTGPKLPKYGSNHFFPTTYSPIKTWTKKFVTSPTFVHFRGILRSNRGQKMVKIGKSRHVTFSNISESKCIISLISSECRQLFGMFHIVQVILGEIGKNCPFWGQNGQKMGPEAPIFTNFRLQGPPEIRVKMSNVLLVCFISVIGSKLR